MPSNVVLPAPLAPSSPVTPRRTMNDAPSSAVVRPHLLTTPCPLMMVSALMRCRSYGPGGAARAQLVVELSRGREFGLLTGPGGGDALRAGGGHETADAGDDPRRTVRTRDVAEAAGTPCHYRRPDLVPGEHPAVD